MKGVFRQALYRICQKIAVRVSQNELFEQEGEREPQAPLQKKMADSALEAKSGCQLLNSDEILRFFQETQKWVVINHWATWCDPCVEELPELRELQRELPDDVLLLGISWDLFEGGNPPKTLDRVAQFMLDHQLDYPCWLVSDEADVFFEKLKLDWRKIPQSLVISPQGEIKKSIHGLLTKTERIEIIETLQKRN